MKITAQQAQFKQTWGFLTLGFVLLAMVLSFAGSFFVEAPFNLVLLVFPLVGIVALAMILRPEYLLVITIAYIPFESAPWFDFLPSAFSVPKLLGFLLLGAVFFHIIFRKVKFRFFDSLQDYAIVFFICTIGFSGIISQYPEVVLAEIDRVIRLVALYFAVKNLADDPRIMWLLLVSLFMTSLISSVYSIYDYSTSETVWGKAVRASGIDDNPNNFALQSSIAIAIGIFLLRASKPVLTKLFFLGGVGIIAVGILLSGSRGGLLAMGVTVGLIILRHPLRLQLGIALAVIAMLSFPVWPDDIRSRLLPSSSYFSNTYEEQARASVERRSAYLTVGADLLTQSPVVGTGFHTFRYWFPRSEFVRFDNPLTEHDTLRVAHNLYLEITVGTGLLGLVALLLMLGSAWYALYHAGNHFPVGSIEWAAARGLEFALISFCVSSLFLSSEFHKELWYLLGMSSAIGHYARVYAGQQASGYALAPSSRQLPT